MILYVGQEGSSGEGVNTGDILGYTLTPPWINSPLTLPLQL